MRLLRIERDHARGDARQHRLDEGAAGVELGVGGAQRAGLLLEPPGHPVEGGRQRLDLVLGLGDRHARREIALLDPPGGVDQLADRPHQAVGELQRGEDRQADDDQRAEQQRGIEFQLVGSRFARAAPDNRCSTSLARSICWRNLRIEHARDVEIGVRAVIERVTRADPVRR